MCGSPISGEARFLFTVNLHCDLRHFMKVLDSKRFEEKM